MACAESLISAVGCYKSLPRTDTMEKKQQQQRRNKGEDSIVQLPDGKYKVTITISKRGHTGNSPYSQLQVPPYRFFKNFEVERKYTHRC